MASPVSYGTFDFDNNPGWRNYCRTFEDQASPEVLLREKARWYKQFVNPAFEVPGNPSVGAAIPASFGPSTIAAPTTGSTGTAAQQTATRPPPVSATPATGGNGEIPSTGPTGVGSTAGTTPATSSRAGASAPAEASASFFSKLQSMDKSRLLDSFVNMSHVSLVLLGSGYLLFMFLRPALAGVLYYQFLLIAAASHLAKVGKRYGAPRVLPWQGFQPTLQKLKSYMMPIAATTDLQYAVISISLISSRPLLPAIVPMFVLAVFHTSYMLAGQYGSHPMYRTYGAPLHSKLVARQRDAQLGNAGAEIMTGFLLIAMILTPARNLLQTFLYWQILRTRYWTPDCREYHRQAWSVVGLQARPLLDKVPALNTPIGFVQRWFESAGQPQVRQQ